MQGKSERRVRRGADEWREILSRCEQSGLSAQEFCQKERVSHTSLDRWQRKLAGTAGSKQFVPVTTALPNASCWTLVITLPDGSQLRLEG